MILQEEEKVVNIHRPENKELPVEYITQQTQGEVTMLIWITLYLEKIGF